MALSLNVPMIMKYIQIYMYTYHMKIIISQSFTHQIIKSQEQLQDSCIDLWSIV